MAKFKHLHDRRGVSFEELIALYGVRAMLASGEIKSTLSFNILPTATAHLFNMGVTCETSHCGSIACIGGYMAMVLQKPIAWVSPYNAQPHPADPERAPKSLVPLFFPHEDDYDHITNKQAIKAIDNWLETGRPKWRAILQHKKGARRAVTAR